MSIKNQIVELEQLDIEIKLLTKQIKPIKDKIKKLKERKKQCEKDIKTYLEISEQPGVKMGDMIIVREEKQIRKPLTKSLKVEKAKTIFEKYGLNDSEDLLDEIMEVMKGEHEFCSKLKIFKNV